VGVLRLPEAAAEVEEIAQGAVGVDVLGCSGVRRPAPNTGFDLKLELGKKRPAVRARGIGEELLECGFGGAFVVNALIAVSLQRLIVSLDRLMGWLDGRRLAHALGLGEGKRVNLAK
jgi:hypothetical protein